MCNEFIDTPMNLFIVCIVAFICSVFGPGFER